MDLLWLAVTPDEFELPLFVADTCEEMAEHYGLDKNTVRTSVSLNLSGKQAKRKFIKVTYEEE